MPFIKLSTTQSLTSSLLSIGSRWLQEKNGKPPSSQDMASMNTSSCPSASRTPQLPFNTLSTIHSMNSSTNSPPLTLIISSSTQRQRRNTVNTSVRSSKRYKKPVSRLILTNASSASRRQNTSA